MRDKIAYSFLSLALISLLVGVFFGTLAGTQYLFPQFLKEYLPFNRMRPFHVTLVVSWIVLAATGGIYFYVSKIIKQELYAPKLALSHFYLFLFVGVLIITTLSFGKMGGREYMVYFPLLSIPILIGWLMFGFNYFKTLHRQVSKWPVYLWMWATGIIFMLITFTEAHLWLIPWFRENHIRDITVQWKSYGALVGSWNMLVYGTAMYVMYGISKNEKLGRGNLAFFLYFLGFTNLLFGWAHHTYIVPTSPIIRNVAYAISMTELLILAKIIWNWKNTLQTAKRHLHQIEYRFLFSSEIWIFLNLTLAILISIPALNLLTHGTHITVAHSMGTTIGINSTILLASVYYIVSFKFPDQISRYGKTIKAGIWIFNISLLVFWISLIVGGIIRSKWMNDMEAYPFREMLAKMNPAMWVFVLAGYTLFVALIIVAMPPLKAFLRNLKINQFSIDQLKGQDK